MSKVRVVAILPHNVGKDVRQEITSRLFPYGSFCIVDVNEFKIESTPHDNAVFIFLLDTTISSEEMACLGKIAKDLIKEQKTVRLVSIFGENDLRGIAMQIAAPFIDMEVYFNLDEAFESLKK